MIWQGYLKTVLDKHKPETSVIEITLKNAEGKLLNRRLFYLCSAKKLLLPKAKVSLKVEQVNEGYLLTLHTDKLAKNVQLGTEADGFFGDNYFDLLPGETKKVLFKTEGIIDDPQNAFKVKSLVNTYD
jgi:beta-mannosidase